MPAVSSDPLAIDEDRIPHEIRRALDQALVLVEGLDPGLAIRPEDDQLVIVQHGQDLAGFPSYRVRAVHLERLCEQYVKHLSVGEGDQALAELRDGTATVIADPDSEYVEIRRASGRFRHRLHRCNLVEGWPWGDVDPKYRVERWSPPHDAGGDYDGG